MRPRRPPTALRRLILACVVAAVLLPVTPRSQGSSYVVYTADGRRSLPFRASGGLDMVPLTQVANLFNLSLTEDTLVGGLVVQGRGQTVLLIPGQSFASVGPGRIVSLPAPVERERGSWQVPVEFIRQVIGPTFNVRVEVRRPNRVLLIGDVRLPRVTGRFDRQGTTGRLLLDIQPATPHRVTRQGARVIVRFDAVALEFTPVPGLIPDLVAAVRVEGPALVIEMGAEAATMRSSDVDSTHLLLEFAPPAPPPLPLQVTAAPGAPGTGPPPQEPTQPIIDTMPGSLRTVVLDPGHGGDDKGVVGPGGTVEKNYVLQFARRLKGAIEARIGLRVLLTRESDEAVPVDRRAALANNNKADLFISLHTNGAKRPTVGGIQVLSLDGGEYGADRNRATRPELPVAFLGGGTRVIEVLPWDLAQIGFTQPSAVVRGLVEAQLARAQLPRFAGPAAELPLRPLVGAGMPAILIELGFLSNPVEERELNQQGRQQRTVNAIVDALVEIRTGGLSRGAATP